MWVRVVWMAAVVGCSGSVELVGSEGPEGSDFAGDPNALCDAPVPQGSLTCTSPSDESDACSLSCADEAGMRYIADCHGQGCSCSFFGGGTACSCSYNEAGTHCGNARRSCCPAPWP